MGGVLETPRVARIDVYAGHVRFAGPEAPVGQAAGQPSWRVPFSDASGCLSGKTYGIRITAREGSATIKSSEGEKMEKTLELDQDINNENVPVSSTDELSSDGGLAADRKRKLGEFSRTNSPLSADEIKKRRTRGWADIRRAARN